MSNRPLPIDKIEHTVVLMFENRSFDHLFGALPGVDGALDSNGEVNQNYYNLPDPTSPPGPSNEPVYLSPVDPWTPQPHDFNHDFGDGMMPDLFGPKTTGYVNGQAIGAPLKTWPATNSGFLSTIAFNVSGDPPNGPAALTYFERGTLKVLHGLAGEFVVCDQWHCDMLGHTEPNRLFMHTATTGNLGIDDADAGNETSETIFQRIEKAGKDWRMYAPPGGQLDTRFLNPSVRNSKFTGIPIAQFAEDAQRGTLPFYSFIMCWQPSATPWTDTSMHPNSMVQPGENLLAAVYNALRRSPSWEKSLLIVNFDENGGIYDHVVPPRTQQPIPGPPAKGFNHYNTVSEFDFTLLGFRIPVLLISPWLRHGVDKHLYQNTSILRFLEEAIGAEPLTERDRNAPSLMTAFEDFGLEQPRQDTPTEMPCLAKSPDPNDPVDLPYGNGTLDWVIDAEANGPLTPMPHMVQVAKDYVDGLPGHADSGKRIVRDFPTNRDLDRYVEQRVRAASWFDQGEHLRADVQIVERAPQSWVWELRDSTGRVVAAPPNGYATAEQALVELDRVRFLLHELCCVAREGAAV